MRYRQLGKSNLQVSTLCLGTMMFGDQTGKEEARSIVSFAHGHGVNFIDTADVYTHGACEATAAFVRPGHPSTPGFTDPGYPLYPRVRG